MEGFGIVIIPMVWGVIIAGSECLFHGTTLDLVADFPDDAAQLACYCDFDFVVMHEPFAQIGEAQVEAVLRGPGFLQNPTLQSFLAGSEADSDSWLLAVVCGAFNEDPAGV